MDTNEVLLKEWSEFKKSNDERLSQIEKKGHADVLLEEKVDKMSAGIGAIEKQIRDLETKSNRIGASSVQAEDVKELQRKAFVEFIRNGTVGEHLVKASGSVGSDAQGGYAVPQSFDTVLGQILRNATPMRQACNVVATPNENYVKLYSLGGAATGWVGETDSRGETAAPTLGKLTPYYGDLYANAYATQKLVQDSAFNVEMWFADEIAKSIAAAENNKFTATDASGTNSPKGLLAYTMAATADSSRAFGTLEKVVTDTSASFKANELIDLVHKLKPGYRPNASWMMPTATVAWIRKFTDTNSGQYLWLPGLGSQPATLLGFPIVENEDIPAVAANKPVIAFGDFRAGYTIADVGTVVNLRDPYTVTPYVRFYVSKRVGGFVSDSNAIKILVTKA